MISAMKVTLEHRTVAGLEDSRRTRIVAICVVYWNVEILMRMLCDSVSALLLIVARRQ